MQRPLQPASDPREAKSTDPRGAESDPRPPEMIRDVKMKKKQQQPLITTRSCPRCNRLEGGEAVSEQERRKSADRMEGGMKTADRMEGGGKKTDAHSSCKQP